MALLLAGCAAPGASVDPLSSTAHRARAAALPSAIHDERAVLASKAGIAGGVPCGDARLCVDHPFTLHGPHAGEARGGPRVHGREPRAEEDAL